MLKSADKISCLLAAAIAFGSLSLCNFEAKAAGSWECSALPEDSSYVNAEDSNLDLYFKTDNNEGRANAERSYDLSDNEQICISFVSEISTIDSSAVRRLNIQNNSLTTTEIINITGSELKVFGTQSEKSLEAQKEYQFDIGIKPDTGYAVVWLDSEQIYSGELGNKWKNFNYSSMNILFRNTSSSQISALESEWKISDYSLTDNSDTFTTSPENGEAFVDSERGGIDIKFSGLKTPEVFSNGNYELWADSEQIGFNIERSGNTARIVPENGLEPSTHYSLTIKTISDVFGTLQCENEIIEFDTADADYEKATVSISADSENIYDNESAYITIDAYSSQGIQKTVIYVNDEEYKVFEGAPENFEFTEKEGTYKMYAEVTDIMGGKAVSETIVINILHNEPPEITVSGLVNGMTYEASKLKSIGISASDPDGTIEYLRAEVNGEEYELDPAVNNTLDLSGLEPDMYTLTVYTADNSGTTESKEIAFTVLEGYTTTRVFESDFNSYTSDGTTNPGITFNMGGDAQLIASKDYGEEHGTVVLFKTDGGEVGGNTAHGSWGRIVTSNTTDGFIIQMDINLINDKGFFYFMLKHPTQAPLAMDVQIKSGELTLNNNGSIAVRRTLTPGEWYTIIYRVDLKNHKYWFTLDDELLADEFNLGNTSLTQVDTRLVMEFPDKVPTQCGLAFDNMTVDYITPIPQVTSVTGDDNEVVSRISPYTNKLNVAVNTELSSATINRETVQLYCGDERVYYDSIKYDSTSRMLTITLSEKLRSDQDYAVVITDSVTTADGGIITGGMRGEFSVDYSDTDVSSFNLDLSGNSIKASGSIYNRTGKPGECYVIVNIFNGIRIVNTYVEKVSYSRATETNFKIEGVDMSGGTRAEAYVWKSLSKPEPVSSRIYYYN